MVQIITDSSADLPRHLINTYGIEVVPLSVRIDGEDYREGIDLTPEQFFERMALANELPRTSQPSPAQFEELFRLYDAREKEILCLTISSGLSGTYQSALVARDLCDANVTVFDTLGGSLAHGMMVLRAAELARDGWSVAEILPEIVRMREAMNIFILLDTVENIVKGGRLSRFKGSVIKTLNIKVILEGQDGKVEMLEKVRGTKRFFERALELIGERKQDFSDTVIGITHTGNFDDVAFLEREINARYAPKQILVNYMGATMGTYAGKGGIILSFA
ncbi:DegV family protein [Exiguobacterium flavidum]|uniref:DegV family protein n=1 Tax=Exiguobacterium flavidum TaxID=2184695 RepID=UPI000DF80843|nr:DegV family protein [Exiguobacterium flavidum]